MPKITKIVKLPADPPKYTESKVSSQFLNQRWLKEHLHAGDALDVYATWPTPAAIVSDGAYGIGGFPGDPHPVRRPKAGEAARQREGRSSIDRRLLRL